jgi:hypothetical protein
MIVDARCFIDFDPSNRARTRTHIGLHPRLLQVMSENPNFKPMVHNKVPLVHARTRARSDKYHFRNQEVLII